ncbi:hypothetical protein AB595_04570 [Massilia sp. WF1]|uniref:hypothetical protein n=1 Tax=unclassified Massilia TaxID=2609279 RepID=UPI000649B446|nr:MULTISPECIES: hypothetical protein [unclassified Massilia]ALK96952.1 hypothetical protein AM586_12475 [Massilia sp. WG5]KLU37905.1 hypothetical protein AB595_04570 [Massilia sp. WF1]
MLKMFGIGGNACPRCEQANKGEASYCASCGLLLGAPRHRPVLVENRWAPGPDELAVFFGVRALSGLFSKTLHVPATARAYILQGEQATEVPQGEYEIEGFFTRLNNLLRDQHAEILVTRSGALPVAFSLEALGTCEHLQVDATLTLSVQIENVPAFARHFMTMPGTIKDVQLRELLNAPVRQLAQEFVAARSLRDMAGRRELRLELDQHLQGGLALLLSGYGLAVTRVDTIALRHDKFDANRARIGTLWLAADEQRVRLEHAKQLDELYGEEEWNRIRREEQDSRLRHRRAELRQDESLEQAGLSLRNAERAQAIRARQIELYGRIVESRTRKQAIERGAVDAVAALEHALAGKRGARQDEAAQWQQLRELAAIRMRTELEVAQQDAAQARAVARQRFDHQLLQQQIRNKIEQARGIEDAGRQRAELARLHEAEQAAAARAREIDDEEHAARLKLLQLENEAHRREAARVLEWQDAQAAGRLALDAEQLRRQVESLRREGAREDALAQHEKLLRTIEADAISMRTQREGEVQAAAAQRAHELELARLEIARAESLGALDDGAKVALAAPANAALLADVMKTQVHAGMSAEQLAALAGVVGAANTDAWRLAQEQVERERVRRDAEEESARRHQFALLGLQNDVNKTALATQAQLGAGLAGAFAGAAAACAHAAAHHGDRYCASCGAALPARG